MNPNCKDEVQILSSHLKAFFEPKSVVVIGASGTSQKPGNDVIRNILANGFEGELHLVNPKGGEILGRKVTSSIEELPHGIDLAIIILPAKLNKTSSLPRSSKKYGLITSPIARVAIRK